MSTSPDSATTHPEASHLFEHLVHHLASMAALMLGAQPRPDSGEHVFDLDGARLFIDQLEMLAIKTKGNLTAGESQFLQQTLTGVRMLFVQASNNPPTAQPARPEAASESTAGQSEESEKRFTKKY